MLPQFILKVIAHDDTKTRSGRFRRWVAFKLRKLLLRYSDPIVTFRIGNATLRMNLSHDLPIATNLHPFYNTNLTRLAKYTNAKYHDLSIIDIGANIGDSAAYIRLETDVPILCLEGNDAFLPALVENAKGFDNVFVESVFVGAEDRRIAASVNKHGGTSRIELEVSQSNTISTKSLETIVKGWPQFQTAKFIKIDTDGFDIPIIRGAIDFLKQRKPVIFFEYDPACFLPLGQDGLSVFNDLLGAGYTSALIYDNLGNFLLSVDLNDKRTLEDLYNYFLGWNSIQYADIAVFSKEDTDLANAVRTKEHSFFSSARGNLLNSK
jgi:FkbM family methyltransferase